MAVDEKIVWMARENMDSLPEVSIPAGYRIRKYVAGEADVWTGLIREAGLGSVGTGLVFENVFSGNEEVREARILFAEDAEGRPVGTIGAWHGKEGPGGGWGTIQHLVVLPSHRKHGIGQALLAQALREQAGVHTGSFLEATTSQHDAIRLYLAAGFQPWISDKDDRQNWKDIAKDMNNPRLNEILYPVPVDPAPKGVVDGLKAAAMPLIGCVVGTGFEDLRPLKKIIADARIVSMGEATHGTREFFQLKHRLIEFLVVEMGFTAFAIEANCPNCLMLDRFVTTGKGDPLDGITDMLFWTWNTEEVLELVRWMRHYNKQASRTVRFYGFDMQSPALAVREVIRNLRAHAPDRAEAIEPHLQPFTDDFSEYAYPCIPERDKVAVKEALFEAREVIRAGQWPDQREHALALLNANVAFQGVTDSNRDKSMAENIRAILDIEGPAGRVAVWAHNAHVSKTGGDGMGGYLDKWFGKQHVVFGFGFGNGSFQAMDKNGAGLKDFMAPPPSTGSLDETLLRTNMPFLALNPSGISADSEAGKWILEPHVSRSTGAQFSDDPEDAPWFSQSCKIGELYDVFLFVAKTTAARPNPDWCRLPPEETPKTALVNNLDYATSMQDGIPRTWASKPRERRTGYDIIVEGGSASLQREVAPWDWGIGFLSKSFDAVPYRGKRIRLTAEGRVVGKCAWDRAYIAVNAHAGEHRWAFESSEGMVFASTLDKPWIQAAWEVRSLEIEVPSKADLISFVFALAGNGTAWIRSIRLDPVL